MREMIGVQKGDLGRRVLTACIAISASFALCTTSWSQSLTWLGTLGGGASRATGVSADGSVVVGGAYTASPYQVRAFRWTTQTGMLDLGTLSGYDSSEATGVSADGSVVVGGVYPNSGVPSQGRAFRWTATGGMQDLGTLGGRWSRATGVSADGSVVVGIAVNDSFSARAFRWTAAGGMQDLNELYPDLLQDRSGLYFAYAISPDGRYIVGDGFNMATWRSEAFLLDAGERTPGDVDGDGDVDDDDLLAVLLAFGCSGSCGAADVNGDGVVDDEDLLIILFNFGG